MLNEQGYVELALACAFACIALTLGLDGKRLKDLSKPMRDGIKQLTT